MYLQWNRFYLTLQSQIRWMLHDVITWSTLLKRFLIIVCTRTDNVTRKMEYKDSSVLSIVLNIYTIYIKIELSDHCTWVIGFMRKMTGTQWSVRCCRRISDKLATKFSFCSGSTAIIWQKKWVAEGYEGLNGESFSSTQGSFNVSWTYLSFRFLL